MEGNGSADCSAKQRFLGVIGRCTPRNMSPDFRQTEARFAIPNRMTYSAASLGAKPISELYITLKIPRESPCTRLVFRTGFPFCKRCWLNSSAQLLREVLLHDSLRLDLSRPLTRSHQSNF
jgi:hypothetical protein